MVEFFLVSRHAEPARLADLVERVDIADSPAMVFLANVTNPIGFIHALAGDQANEAVGGICGAVRHQMPQGQ